MKRLLLAVTTLAIVLVPTPAFAASAKITNLSSGAVVTNTITVQCQGSGSSGVSKVELFINGSSVSKNTPGGVQSSASTSYGWATNGLRNGSYSLRCTATENSGASDSQTISVTVDNAPSTPSGVSASANGNQITVSWNSNPEPDITGYRVERDSGGGFSAITTAGGTSHTDSPGPGNHSYRVTAIRNSTISGGKAGSPSGTASAYIAPPPEPDPTTPGPGTGDTGGGTGGTGGGNNNGGGGWYNSGGGGGGGNSNGGGGGGSSNPFVVGGKQIAQTGLPSFGSLTLPGVRRPPELPRTEAFDWGTYDEELPFAAPASGQTKVLDEQFGSNIAAMSPDRVIPPDGLRWLAMGVLLLVSALLLRFLAGRATREEERIVQAALAEIKSAASTQTA